MSYIACIKDRDNTFEIESATWFVVCPRLTLTVNKPSGFSFMDMIDRIVEHTLRRLKINKGSVTEFRINTGLCEKIQIKITFKYFDMENHIENYRSGLLYVLFMIAYSVDSNLVITKEEMNNFAVVREKIKSSELTIWN